MAHLSTLEQPHAGDDARSARWVPVAPLLADPTQLAFDHHAVLTAAVATA